MNHKLRFATSLFVLLLALSIFVIANPPKSNRHDKTIIVQGGKSTGQDVGFGLTLHEDVGSGKLISIPVAYETNYFQMDIDGELVLKVVAPGSKTNVTVRVGDSLKTIAVINRDRTNVLQAKESGRIETSMLTVSDRPPIVLLRVFLSTNISKSLEKAYGHTLVLDGGDALLANYDYVFATNRLLNFVVGFRDGTNEVEIATFQKVK